MDRLGRDAMLNVLQMGGFRIANLGVGLTSADAVTLGQLQTAVIPSGTSMLFCQASAPAGWTQNPGYDDALPRIVRGTTGGTQHGAIGFSVAQAAGTSAYTLQIQDIPPHAHPVIDQEHTHQYTPTPLGGGTAGGGAGGDSFCQSYGSTTLTTAAAYTGIQIGNAGGGGGHSHPVQQFYYVDMIVCSKN